MIPSKIIYIYILVFLKVYAPNEEAHCAIVDWPCKKTFSKWSWYFTKKIFLLQHNVIDLENRFAGYDIFNIPVDFLS